MIQELIEAGLNDKEAKLYILSLKTGDTTANRLADLSQYPRSTVYDILEKLKQKGFINTYVRDKRTLFSANSPQFVIGYLKERMNEAIADYEKRVEQIETIIPKMSAYQKSIPSKPVAEVFEGVVSVSGILDEIVDEAEKVDIIGSQEGAEDRIGFRTDSFRTKRKRKGVRVRQILEDSPPARRETTDKLSKVRYLKSLKGSREAQFIYDDVTVHLILSDEISAIRVSSKEYTDAKRILFEELWKNASR